MNSYILGYNTYSKQLVLYRDENYPKDFDQFYLVIKAKSLEEAKIKFFKNK
jgi:hypothetical protein